MIEDLSETTQSSLAPWRTLWSVQPASWQESLHQRPSSRAGNGRIHLEVVSILSVMENIYIFTW